MGDLTANFSRKEFACKCGCGLDNVSVPFVRKLQRARDKACKRAGRTVRFSISSGVRCKARNLAEGGKKNSSHLPHVGPSDPLMTAHAADIKTASSRQRYYVLYGMMQVFDRIGDGDGFLHADDDERKGAEVVWNYYR